MARSSAQPKNRSSKTPTPPPRRRYFRKFLLALALLIIAALVALVWWAKQQIPFDTYTVHSKTATYRVMYPKGAQQVSSNDTVYLQASDPASRKLMLLRVDKAVQSQHECQAASSDTIVVTRLKIEGTDRNLCYVPSTAIYGLNFTHGNTWYFATILPKNPQDRLDEQTVKKVLATVHIQ
jgi:hypothetical protein